MSDERGSAIITVFLDEELQVSVFFYLTSFENSLGHIFYKWNDGEQLKYKIGINSRLHIQIQPEKYRYLEQTSKCHDEPFYDCIASALDEFDYQGLCNEKCIPDVFGFGRNYTSPFCKIQKDDYCARDTITKKIVYKTFESTCQKACTALQYSGDFMAITSVAPVIGVKINESKHELYYEFSNSESKCKVFEEYLIYDTMGMIGSVGGTLGMFIGFSITGVISSAIDYLRKCKSLINSM